jgi:hypothetical protein
MTFEFLEPNGRQRYAVGSVDLIDDNHVLVGWGAIVGSDERVPQRAVSIVRVSDRKEVFSMDLSPGWISYRVKASQH